MNFNILFLIFNTLLFLNSVSTKKCYVKKKNIKNENNKNGNVLNLTVNKNSVFTKTVSYDILSSSETELEDEFLDISKALPTSTTEDDIMESLPTTSTTEDDTMESSSTYTTEDVTMECSSTSIIEDSTMESSPTTSITKTSTMESSSTSIIEDSTMESSPTTSITKTSTIESSSTSIIEDSTMESSPTTSITKTSTMESSSTSIIEDSTMESSPTTSITKTSTIESSSTSIIEDSTMESSPTTSITKTSTIESSSTSITKTSTIESLPTNYCKNEITIDNSNFNIVYFQENIMYDKCILSDFYFNEKTFNINSIMYCGKLYLNDNVEKYNITIEKNLSIQFGIYIMEIEKVYEVKMVNSSNEKLCIDLKGKQNLEYKKEKKDDFVLLSYKEESSLFITNKYNEIIKKDCLNKIEYKVKPSLISSVKEDLCGKEEHLLKIKNLINKNKNSVNTSITVTTKIPEPTNVPVNKCNDKINSITYAEIENKTFNFGGYVIYNKNLCKVNLVSNGPMNYYTLNPYNQKVQINGFIECLYYDDNGEEIKYDKKIRIESLNGARKYEILSNINPYADYIFFEPFKYTSTTNLSTNDSLPDFSRGKFSMYNYITYYNDKEKQEEIGSIKASWIYNVFVGDNDDVWITC